MNHCFFNLLRRPPCVFVMASFDASSPSGFVLGVGVAGRGVERIIVAGGEGPDCTFPFYLEVLFVKIQGLDVISFFLKALLVLIPTI